MFFVSLSFRLYPLSFLFLHKCYYYLLFLFLVLHGEHSSSIASASSPVPTASLHHRRSPVPSLPLPSTKIAGAPVIRCEETRIRLAIRTTEPFGGNVYAKGYFHRENCRVSGNGVGNSANITIPVNSDCGMRRRRSVNPQGIVLEMTVIVMFHNKFLTQNDRAFKLECIYVEINQQLRNALTIADMPASELNDVAKNPPAMPKCTYEVLTGKENGMPVTFATLGQPVYHKWSCRPPGSSIQKQLLNNAAASSSRNMVDTNELENLNNQSPNGGNGGVRGELPPPYCLTVHSCDVDDGQGNIQRLVDGNGCSTDAGLFGEIAYDDDGLEAWRVGHVFKFADHPTVYFSCQIRLVLKRDIAEKCERSQCTGASNSIADTEVEASGITSEGSSVNVSVNDVLIPPEQPRSGTASDLGGGGGGQKRLRFQQKQSNQKQNSQNSSQKPMSPPSSSVPPKNSHLITLLPPPSPPSPSPPALPHQRRRGGGNSWEAEGGDRGIGSPPAIRPPTTTTSVPAAAAQRTTPKKAPPPPSPPSSSTLSPTKISSTVTVTPVFHHHSTSDISSSSFSSTAFSDAHSSEVEQDHQEEEAADGEQGEEGTTTSSSTHPTPSPSSPKLLTLARRTTTTTKQTTATTPAPSTFSSSSSSKSSKSDNSNPGEPKTDVGEGEEAVGAWIPLDDNTEEDNTGNKSPAIIASPASSPVVQQRQQQQHFDGGVSEKATVRKKTPSSSSSSSSSSETGGDGRGEGDGGGGVQRYERSSSTTHHTVPAADAARGDGDGLVLQNKDNNSNHQNSGDQNKKWREPLAVAEQQRRSGGGRSAQTKNPPKQATKNAHATTVQQHESDSLLQKQPNQPEEERKEKTGDHNKKTSSSAATSSSRANSSSGTDPVPLSVFELDVSPVAVDVLDAIHPVISSSSAEEEPRKGSSSSSASLLDIPLSSETAINGVGVGSGQRFDVLQSAVEKNKNVCVSSMFLTGALLVTGLALGAALSAFCCFVWCRLKDPWALFTCRKRSSRHREAHLPHREDAFWAGVARPGRQQHRPAVSASSNNNNGIHFC